MIFLFVELISPQAKSKYRQRQYKLFAGEFALWSRTWLNVAIFGAKSLPFSPIELIECVCLVVVYHSGMKTTGGHYWTNVFHPGVHSWVHFDDNCITPIPAAEVFTFKSPAVPYLLYYKKCAPQATWAILPASALAPVGVSDLGVLQRVDFRHPSQVVLILVNTSENQSGLLGWYCSINSQKELKW